LIAFIEWIELIAFIEWIELIELIEWIEWIAHSSKIEKRRNGFGFIYKKNFRQDLQDLVDIYFFLSG